MLAKNNIADTGNGTTFGDTDLTDADTY